jgi:hypothetical protein
MGTDKLVELSQKIYSNHREIIDFILENKPDLTTEVRELVMGIVSSKGYVIGSENKYYVRFLHPDIDPLIYRNSVVKNGWKLRESFLHEIVISVRYGRIIYKPVLSPSDQNYNSDGLLNLLLEIEGFRQPYGKKWRVPIMKDVKFNFDEFETLTQEEKIEKLDKVISKFLPVIQKVDQKLLDNKSSLEMWIKC